MFVFLSTQSQYGQTGASSMWIPSLSCTVENNPLFCPFLVLWSSVSSPQQCSPAQHFFDLDAPPCPCQISRDNVTFAFKCCPSPLALAAVFIWYGLSLDQFADSARMCWQGRGEGRITHLSSSGITHFSSSGLALDWFKITLKTSL